MADYPLEFAQEAQGEEQARRLFPQPLSNFRRPGRQLTSTAAAPLQRFHSQLIARRPNRKNTSENPSNFLKIPSKILLKFLEISQNPLKSL